MDFVLTDEQESFRQSLWSFVLKEILEAGMAKTFASETALAVCLDAMRIHGAQSYSTEHVVERLYRDAPLMAIGEGTNGVLRTVVARSLLTGKGRVGFP